MRSAHPSSAAAKSPMVRGAVPAQPHRALYARDSAFCDGFAGVQVGPMSRNLKPADLRGDQGVFVGIGDGEGAGRIQLH
jgi:hypothetical protein